MESPQIVVVGAGLGGLAVGRELKHRGIHDFVIAERAADIGGTWREHTYPNVACDTPVELYSFSFQPSSDWSSNFAPGAEIFDYIKRVVKSQGLDEHVVVGTNVTSAQWDDDSRRWSVTTDRGDRWEPTYLVAAVGRFSRPDLRPFPGVDVFHGPVFHTSCWDHGVDLAGKRVAVVGGGASAIQVLPYTADVGKSVVAFVPTPSHVLPKEEERYDEARRAQLRESPEEMARLRAKWADYFDQLAALRFPFDRAQNDAATGQWRAYMHSVVTDPELRRVLTPKYPMGCRRTLFSNDYYPAIVRPHVTVVGDRLESLTERGARSTRGEVFDVDAVVLATGYEMNSWLSDVELVGRDGRLLADHWAAAGGPRAYLGLMVDGFPNFFLVDGPNAQTTSITGTIEAHARYIGQCLELVADQGKRSIEVTPEAFAVYNAEIDERIDASVLVHCDSYYRIGGTGRVSSHWPGTVAALEQRLETPDQSALRIE